MSMLGNPGRIQVASLRGWPLLGRDESDDTWWLSPLSVQTPTSLISAHTPGPQEGTQDSSRWHHQIHTLWLATDGTIRYTHSDWPQMAPSDTHTLIGHRWHHQIHTLWLATDSTIRYTHSVWLATPESDTDTLIGHRWHHHLQTLWLATPESNTHSLIGPSWWPQWLASVFSGGEPRHWQTWLL